MTIETVGHTRPITQEEIDAYERDGAVVLRGIMPIEWVALAREALEEVRLHPANAEFFGDGNRSFLANMNAPRNPKLWSYVTESPAGAIAGVLHGAARMHYYLDQIFYKDAGPIVRSSWHQDTPYFNVVGDDIVRVWQPCDPIPRELSLEVVRGSHKWGVQFQRLPAADMETVRPADEGSISVQDLGVDTSAPPLPDIAGNRGSFDILGWEVELGDIVVFHGHTLHGTGGTQHHPTTRRALAVMYAAPRERFLRRPGNALPDIATVRNADLENGALVGDHPDVYPLVWEA
jgi:ectoine hydroxylase-related dioxygenase (phytanoyl-CoA dioxygenase family)